MIGKWYNNREINRMLARDDEEFEMYEEFDRMRYDEEKQTYSNFEYGVNYRLMPESEVPDYIKIKEEKKKKVLGKRRNYREFYNVVPDIDETSEEERKSKKRASQRLKRKRRAKAKAKAKKNGKGNGQNGKSKGDGGKFNVEKKEKENNTTQQHNGKNKIIEEKDDIFVDSDD